MIKNRTQKLERRGSMTAKRGFKKEKDVVKKFNNWKKDRDAQEWLKIMGYDIKEIEKVKAIQVTGSHKTDVQVEIKIYLKQGLGIENISVKLVSNPQGFNQIDKRWIDKYAELWNMPDKLLKTLKMFTGEIKPLKPSKKDNRRIFLDELSKKEQKEIIDFFEKNKILIVNDLFKGRDNFPAIWMLIYQKDTNIWTFVLMSVVMNFYGNGKVFITKQGSLKIGKIGMQRKGGDAGRPSATMLQFKMNPCEITNYIIKNNGQND